MYSPTKSEKCNLVDGLMGDIQPIHILKLMDPLVSKPSLQANRMLTGNAELIGTAVVFPLLPGISSLLRTESNAAPNDDREKATERSVGILSQNQNIMLLGTYFGLATLIQ